MPTTEEEIHAGLYTVSVMPLNEDLCRMWQKVWAWCTFHLKRRRLSFFKLKIVRIGLRLSLFLKKPYLDENQKRTKNMLSAKIPLAIHGYARLHIYSSRCRIFFHKIKKKNWTCIWMPRWRFFSKLIVIAFFYAIFYHKKYMSHLTQYVPFWPKTKRSFKLIFRC
jgi:hypothetical protein